MVTVKKGSSGEATAQLVRKGKKKKRARFWEKRWACLTEGTRRGQKFSVRLDVRK